MWGVLRGQRALGPSHVRGPVGPHFPVAPRLPGRPLHGVVAVEWFVDQEDQLSLGGMAAPAVLDHHGIAMLGVALGPPHPLQVLLPVGGPFQEGRQGARGVGGPVEVGSQADSVPHRDHDVSIDPQGHGQSQSRSRSSSTMGMDRELTARSTDPRSLKPCPVTMQTARLADVTVPADRAFK